ncbi:MAG: FprA family A-type flavoprotein [Paludibacteraceae bacterium]|nr:FprA family A-type flavoprotein [Paludibacteraceae bacterium]
MKITDDILYIGVQDRDIRLFERQYPTPYGMAYNSYLILDEKVAVMDTADLRMHDEWKAGLAAALDGRQPDYLVMHHMEPDHSALAMEMLEHFPNLKIVASQKAIQMLPQFFEGVQLEGRTIAVKEGDTLSLGTHTLRFLMAPMVHWPEVMVSYDEESKTLFSADAFGSFGTLDQQEDDWACEARRYYFNICGKYGAPVQTLLKKAGTLEIERICPLHGPVIVSNKEDATVKSEAKDKAVSTAFEGIGERYIADDKPVGYYLGLYDIWSRYEAEKQGVFVGYASIHGGTKAVAEHVAQLLRDRGVKVCLMDLTEEEVSFAVEDAFAYGRAVFAASSYDAGLFPPMHNLLHHLQIKGWQKKRVALIENGSWAPSAGKVMREMLGAMKDVEIIEPMVTIRSRMKSTDKEALEALVTELMK